MIEMTSCNVTCNTIMCLKSCLRFSLSMKLLSYHGNVIRFLLFATRCLAARSSASTRSKSASHSTTVRLILAAMTAPMSEDQGRVIRPVLCLWRLGRVCVSCYRPKSVFVLRGEIPERCHSSLRLASWRRKSGANGPQPDSTFSPALCIPAML